MAKKSTAAVITKRGLGQLFKRCADGKDYPASSKKPGIFYLRWQEDGVRKKKRLDVNGEPVTDLKIAQEEQLRLRGPYVTGGKLEVLKIVESEIRVLEKQHEQQLDKADPPLTIEKAWDAYINAGNRSEPSPQTLETYLAHWRDFASWLGSRKERPVYLRDVTEKHAEDFLKHVRDSGYTNNTHNKRLTFMRMFFRVLAKPARIQANPFAEIPHRELETNSRRVMTLDELSSVLTTAKGELQLLLMEGTFLGLRLGDCCTLCWEEIDLVDEVVRRRPRKTRKVNKKITPVGIPPVLLKAFLQLPAANRSGYILPSMADLYLQSHGPSKVTRIVQAHLKKCGIETHAPGTGAKYHYEGKKKVYDESKRAVVEVGFHSLRHTWISRHINEGTPNGIVQESAGHMNPVMTQHYTHVSEDTARSIASIWNVPELAIDGEVIQDDITTMREKLRKIIDSSDRKRLSMFLEFAQKCGPGNNQEPQQITEGSVDHDLVHYNRADSLE